VEHDADGLACRVPDPVAVDITPERGPPIVRNTRIAHHGAMISISAYQPTMVAEKAIRGSAACRPFCKEQNRVRNKPSLDPFRVQSHKPTGCGRFGARLRRRVVPQSFRSRDEVPQWHLSERNVFNAPCGYSTQAIESSSHFFVLIIPPPISEPLCSAHAASVVSRSPRYSLKGHSPKPHEWKRESSAPE